VSVSRPQTRDQSEDISYLIKAFSVLEDEEESRRFLHDLCTVGELEIMAQRLKVASLLFRCETYNRIADRTGASTATISRIKRFLTNGCGGYRMILERLGEKGDL